jgi:tRNA threonylcarbamoyladenosine modification (KEOPS) complex  Pcc1 subunit
MWKFLIEGVINSEIIIKSKDPKNLKKLLDLEIKRKKYKRSDSKIYVEKNLLKIKIYANDLIAYKATINNYINLLELISKVYEVEL